MPKMHEKPVQPFKACVELIFSKIRKFLCDYRLFQQIEPRAWCSPFGRYSSLFRGPWCLSWWWRAKSPSRSLSSRISAVSSWRGVSRGRWCAVGGVRRWRTPTSVWTRCRRCIARKSRAQIRGSCSRSSTWRVFSTADCGPHKAADSGVTRDSLWTWRSRSRLAERWPRRDFLQMFLNFKI